MVAASHLKATWEAARAFSSNCRDMRAHESRRVRYISRKDFRNMKAAAALVLIVDDEVNLRASLVELVESEGFNAAQAANGEEAVSVLRGGTVDPDVILLDMR